MSLTLTKYPQRVDAVKILGIAFPTPRNVPLLVGVQINDSRI